MDLQEGLAQLRASLHRDRTSPGDERIGRERAMGFARPGDAPVTCRVTFASDLFGCRCALRPAPQEPVRRSGGGRIADLSFGRGIRWMMGVDARIGIGHRARLEGFVPCLELES